MFSTIRMRSAKRDSSHFASLSVEFIGGKADDQFLSHAAETE